MVTGFAGSNSLVPVLGVGVRVPQDVQEANVFRLAEATCEHMGIPGAVKREQVVANCNYIGKGYGFPAKSTIEAIELLARTEGILLDPVYSGKGFAGLVDLVRQGHFKAGENVVFVHTGGSQALFGYREAFNLPKYTG
ncbi:pyridoxal-phosphate dependent enzyme [Marinobacterium jannaschii]|uniref:pyridoxal-phosphate dependent enzyme n=1 Tax=Marinobacterium jannaschii TaxID=64970 RepID=UPI0009FF24B8|nr:pyridoxal-phosphate dependent enzyme [Marinobacterium jannaschii]